MSAREDWLFSHVAPTSEALAAGDGCHRDEVRTLGRYLDGSMTAQDAARHITGPVSHEKDPPAELCRLWGLLSEAMVQLSDERQKIMDLLCAMQTLPSTPGIEWSQLPGFGHMWSDLYRLHLHGGDPWEDESLPNDRKAELSKEFRSMGMAEAEMYVRGLEVPADWAYEVINLVCSRRPGLDVLINEVYAWLEVAGAKLKEDVHIKQDVTRGFPRPIVGSRNGEQQAVSNTMAEHWATWERTLSDLSGGESSLSAEGRTLAGKCQVLMQGTT